MSDIFTKNKSWLVPLLFNLVLSAVIYMHSLSVKATIVYELKAYVTKDELTMREDAHSQWSAEAVKRIEGKIDDLGKRFERVESRPPRHFERPQ